MNQEGRHTGNCTHLSMGNSGPHIFRNGPYAKPCGKPAHNLGQHVGAGDGFVEGTTAFKIPAKLVRSTDSGVIEYLRWFAIEFRPKLLERWSTTSWIICKARRFRRIELHTYRCSEVQESIPTFTQNCNFLDARDNDYVLSEVTGMDYRVLRCLSSKEEVAELIGHVVLNIESQDLDRATPTSDAGTHRSVGVRILLILLAYPYATFHPHTKRTVEEARWFYGLIA